MQSIQESGGNYLGIIDAGMLVLEIWWAVQALRYVPLLASSWAQNGRRTNLASALHGARGSSCLRVHYSGKGLGAKWRGRKRWKLRIKDAGSAYEFTNNDDM